MVVFQLLHPALLYQTSIHRQGHQMYDFHIFLYLQLLFSKDDCSKASKGSFSLLSPSTPLFRNLTFFPFLRNQMMVVKPVIIARKTVGEGSFVKRRDIVSLMSIVADDKDASSLY